MTDQPNQPTDQPSQEEASGQGEAPPEASQPQLAAEPGRPHTDQPNQPTDQPSQEEASGQGEAPPEASQPQLAAEPGRPHTDQPNQPTDQPSQEEASGQGEAPPEASQPQLAAEPGHPDEEPGTEAQRLAELRDTAEAIGKLAADEKLFNLAVEAFRARDAEQFQAVLAAAGVLQRCRLICRWLCSKHCVFICRKLCDSIEGQHEIDVAEMREFAFVTERLAQDEALLKRLIAAVDREDAKTFRQIIAELKLERFCHQLCHYLCAVRCRLVCKLMCPPPPLITKVGYIPRAHINAAGYASGASNPPGFTPADDPANGIGDHPFGGLTHINGTFSIAGPFQYKVEFATNPAGPWTPIIQPLPDFKLVGMILVDYTRVPDAGGWYDVADMGLGSEGQTYLTDWPTPPAVSDLYYLKLTVRTAAPTGFESPIVPVRIDNTAPTKPLIKLQLKKPDGSLIDLDCCEKVEQGDE